MEQWIKTANKFSPIGEDFSIIDKLPVGVYSVSLDLTGWHFHYEQDKFYFDYKVYGIQDKFIEHVLKTYNNTTNNLGILLNGTKGTGKTVTAKQLSNRLNLPVILVKSMGEQDSALLDFLSKLNFECVFFFDEFEKNFNEMNSDILSMMDGVYNSKYRKIFLLTTNKLDINDNLIGRPSRIRYIKTFGNLELSVVEEYLKDNLEDQSKIEDVINYIDSLKISTIDILKSVVNEINIHGIEAFGFSRTFYNVQYTDTTIRGYRTYFELEQLARLADKGETYSMEDFEKDLAIVKKGYPEFKGDTFSDQDAYSEYMRKRSAAMKTKCPRTIYPCNISFKGKYKALQIGDYFDGGKIIKIDFIKNIIITKDEDVIYLYKIEGEGTTSSLYHEEQNYGLVF